jgi:hypothetical protein
VKERAALAEVLQGNQSTEEIGQAIGLSGRMVRYQTAAAMKKLAAKGIDATSPQRGRPRVPWMVSIDPTDICNLSTRTNSEGQTVGRWEGDDEPKEAEPLDDGERATEPTNAPLVTGCQRCKTGKRRIGDRYCKKCTKAVMKEMRQNGYLT